MEVTLNIIQLRRHRPQIEKVSETHVYAVRIGCENRRTAGSQTFGPMRPNLRTTGSPFEDLLVPQRSNKCFSILEPRVANSRN